MFWLFVMEICVFDINSTDLNLPFSQSRPGDVPAARSSGVFRRCKRAFDICFSLLLLPVLGLAALSLVVLNPLANPGNIIFSQIRMGRGCKPFVAYKFRSMTAVTRMRRGADDPLETDRITRLGRVIRKFRIDELPQIINVLKGDMSLIGPRPDYIHHARKYLRDVPGYRHRHAVRPGISGLAQTEVGYIHGIEALAKKVRADIYYINNSGFSLELWIFWRTLITVFGRQGE
ncbi:sugar transferase [Pseudodonghicola flavimaris]|uniref:Sugar transferase n=1 Tax=Pseudodonghicola flavimaris TaxID=3050036 RepID=A0ABT7EZI1_9RHOB|nr:sugar transferase [Pseudodonghicola flavimaris]MDK3017758.1 sugar transferase [Pseudodonghicola flavimaris]